jgi:cation transport ATPase
LEFYNGAAQFNAISLVAIVFGQFSILQIVPIVRALWIAALVLAIVYLMILFAGSYFLSQYFVFARGIWRIRKHRGMGMNYRMLEETLEAETQECVSGWYRRRFRSYLIEKDHPNDLLLHEVYWVISVVLLVIMYLAPR